MSMFCEKTSLFSRSVFTCEPGDHTQAKLSSLKLFISACDCVIPCCVWAVFTSLDFLSNSEVTLTFCLFTF